MPAKIVELANGVVSLLQAAISANQIGSGSVPREVSRVPFVRTEQANDETGTIRLRVAARSSAGEPIGRGGNSQHDEVIYVATLRKLKSTEQSDADVADAIDALLLIQEQIEDCLTKDTHQRPAAHAAFIGFNYGMSGNKQGLKFNPEGITERRQFEAIMQVTYRGSR